MDYDNCIYTVVWWVMVYAQQALPASSSQNYVPRRPEKTVLYRVIQETLETFHHQVEMETGHALPEFVGKEFDAFLLCGVLAHGFLRAKCEGCSHETLVAFSCKCRGFCPSCGTRQMVETAAHLVEDVIP